MYNLIKDEKLLEKYESIWNRISNIIGKILISNQFMVKLEFSYGKNSKSFTGKSTQGRLSLFLCGSNRT